MFENFITVGTQVVELFILIGIGFLCGKTKMLNDKTAKSITDIVLYIVCPCVIIENFIRPFDTNMLGGLLTTAAASFLIQLLSIVIAMLIFHDKEPKKNRVLLKVASKNWKLSSVVRKLLIQQKSRATLFVLAPL